MESCRNFQFWFFEEKRCASANVTLPGARLSEYLRNIPMSVVNFRYEQTNQ